VWVGYNLRILRLYESALLNLILEKSCCGFNEK
jgi:hypothetical protein